jgi:hypothetical protein
MGVKRMSRQQTGERNGTTGGQKKKSPKENCFSSIIVVNLCGRVGARGIAMDHSEVAG